MAVYSPRNAISDSFLRLLPKAVILALMVGGVAVLYKLSELKQPPVTYSLSNQTKELLKSERVAFPSNTLKKIEAVINGYPPPGLPSSAEPCALLQALGSSSPCPGWKPPTDASSRDKSNEVEHCEVATCSKEQKYGDPLTGAMIDFCDDSKSCVRPGRPMDQITTTIYRAMKSTVVYKIPDERADKLASKYSAVRDRLAYIKGKEFPSKESLLTAAGGEQLGGQVAREILQDTYLEVYKLDDDFVSRLCSSKVALSDVAISLPNKGSKTTDASTVGGIIDVFPYDKPLKDNEKPSANDKKALDENAFLKKTHYDEIRKALGDTQAQSIKTLLLGYGVDKTVEDKVSDQIVRPLVSGDGYINVVYHFVAILSAILVITGLLLILLSILKLLPFLPDEASKIYEGTLGSFTDRLKNVSDKRPDSGGGGGSGNLLSSVTMSTAATGLGLLAIVGVTVALTVKGDTPANASANVTGNGTVFTDPRQRTPVNQVSLSEITDELKSLNKSLRDSNETNSQHIKDLIDSAKSDRGITTATFKEIHDSFNTIASTAREIAQTIQNTDTKVASMKTLLESDRGTLATNKRLIQDVLDRVDASQRRVELLTNQIGRNQLASNQELLDARRELNDLTSQWTTNSKQLTNIVTEVRDQGKACCDVSILARNRNLLSRMTTWFTGARYYRLTLTPVVVQPTNQSPSDKKPAIPQEISDKLNKYANEKRLVNKAYNEKDFDNLLIEALKEDNKKFFKAIKQRSLLPQ